MTTPEAPLDMDALAALDEALAALSAPELEAMLDALDAVEPAE